MTLDDLVADLVEAKTGAVLAAEIGIDAGKISNFKNGKTGLTIPVLTRLLNLAGYTLTKKDDREKLIDVFLTTADLVKEFKDK
jgi:hypothetical protein